MSDAYTVLSADGSSGYGARGHVTREAVIADARRHYEAQALEAAVMLAALDSGEFTVHHQYGIHIARRRVEVLATDLPEGTT